MDELWVMFESLGSLLNTRQQQQQLLLQPPVRPLAGVVLADELVAEFNERLERYRSRCAADADAHAHTHTHTHANHGRSDTADT